MFSYRRVYLYVCLICLAMLGVAAWQQYGKGIQPCLLCIMQRIIISVLALLTFAAVLHNHNQTSRKVYNVLALLVTLLGIALAGRQVWLQYRPADHALCIPGQDYLGASYIELMKYALKGYGDCSRVEWKFLGWSTAHWTLAVFVVIAAIVLWQSKNKRY